MKQSNWESDFWKMVEEGGNGADIRFIQKLKSFISEERNKAFEEGKEAGVDVVIKFTEEELEAYKYTVSVYRGKDSEKLTEEGMRGYKLAFRDFLTFLLEVSKNLKQ